MNKHTRRTPPAEVTHGTIVPRAYENGAAAQPVPVAVAPTQLRRPWRSTARTVFQLVVALATLLPFVVAGIYTDAAAVPVAVAQVLTVAGAITRVMALPQVEVFLRQFAPFLAAAPDPR